VAREVWRWNGTVSKRGKRSRPTVNKRVYRSGSTVTRRSRPTVTKRVYRSGATVSKRVYRSATVSKRVYRVSSRLQTVIPEREDSNSVGKGKSFSRYEVLLDQIEGPAPEMGFQKDSCGTSRLSRYNENHQRRRWHGRHIEPTAGGNHE
jgi:hypothetical protein